MSSYRTSSRERYRTDTDYDRSDRSSEYGGKRSVTHGEARGDERSSKRPRSEDDKLSKSGGSGQEGERFVWRKKVEQERKRGIRTTLESEDARIRELHHELEEAKRQRAIRDAERAEREAEARIRQREREQELHAGQDMNDEDKFLGRQHYIRQALRLRNGRGRMIDLVARVVRLDIPIYGEHNNNEDIVRIITNLSSAELHEFIEEVEDELDYLVDFPTTHDSTMFHDGTRRAFWQAVKNLAVTRKNELNKNGSTNGVRSDVINEVDALLRDKSIAQLNDMNDEISSRLSARSDDGEVDNEFAEVDFWTAALDRVRSLLSVHRLRECVRSLRVERREQYLRRENEQKPSSHYAHNSSDVRVASSSSHTRARNDSRRDDDDVDDGIDRDRERRKEGHGAGRGQQRSFKSVRELEQNMLDAEASRGMNENEMMFTEEVDLGDGGRHSGYGRGRDIHSNRDRALQLNGQRRKPLYYNRVHTGYIWSKYNRTHYDHDNPPPKTVQGYKFNIFYPDLDDPSKTPTYVLRKTENPDVSIIVFKAGPPYEDVAFKIINRPWERSHKRGFRSSFDRGVLQLWFYFQHYRYRR